MSEILLPVVHPVPVPWRARPGTRPGLRIGRAVTEGRIAVVSKDAFEPMAFPFMVLPGTPTRAFRHDGRVWSRLFEVSHGYDGRIRRHDIPLERLLASLRREAAEADPLFPPGTPLRAWFDDRIGAEVDGDDPVRADLLAGCRAALQDYLRADLRACEGFLYVRIGLPCLSGTGVPELIGAGPGWRPSNEMMLTRHDRVAAHVRYVGRCQADDEDARFRYFAGLVEGIAEGIVPDEMALGLFVNRLAVLAFQQFEVHDRRWRGEDPDRHADMRRIMDRLAPMAALGLVGALPAEGWADCVRACLGALDAADLGKSARVLREELRAFAEEVALPALEPVGPEVDADVAALSALGP